MVFDLVVYLFPIQLGMVELSIFSYILCVYLRHDLHFFIAMGIEKINEITCIVESVSIKCKWYILWFSSSFPVYIISWDGLISKYPFFLIVENGQ